MPKTISTTVRIAPEILAALHQHARAKTGQNLNRSQLIKTILQDVVQLKSLDLPTNDKAVKYLNKVWQAVIKEPVKILDTSLATSTNTDEGMFQVDPELAEQLKETDN